MADDINKKVDDILENSKMAVGKTGELEVKYQAQAEEITKLKAQAEKDATDKVANQKALDELIAKQKEFKIGANQFKGFEQHLAEGLEAKKAFLTDYKTNKKGFSIEMDTKAVAIMGSGTHLTGSYLVPPTIVPGVLPKLFEESHMRSLLPNGSTNSNIIRYIQDNGGEGAPTMVAEGAAKPQSDRDLEIKDAPVRKMATYFRVPEEMVEDIPYLSSFLSQIGIEEVNVVEDNQILYGDGTGQNLTGFNTAGTAFAAGTSVIGASANEFDVIGAAKKQLRVSKFGGPLVGLIAPVNYYDMRYKRKDTTNNYLFMGGGNGIDPGLNWDGVRIIEHTAVVAGDFFVFTPRAAAIFDRAGTTVRFYDQDQDNAIKNLITIVIEKRIALPIYYPLGIIKGTIAAAITDLTS